MKIKKSVLEIELARQCLSFYDLRKHIASATLTKVINSPGYDFTPKIVGKIARALNVDVEAIIDREA